MKILRPRQAAEKLGIGLPTIWAWAREKPDFPKPIQLSGNASGFIESELDAFLEKKVAEFRAAPAKRETAVAAAQKSALARRQRAAVAAGGAQ
jgi:prophage regulatory protein